MFAPNSKHRALVTPAKRGKGIKLKAPEDGQTSAESHVAMMWAQCLKRVFSIDVETCSASGRAIKSIAYIEDPVVIKKILTHLSLVVPTPTGLLPEGLTPPSAGLLASGSCRECAQAAAQ